MWRNIALWEWMLEHQKNPRIWNPPNIIDSLFILLICITKNTQVLDFSNGHFWPKTLPPLSYAPSLTLLICCSLSFSLSFLLHQLPTLFSSIVISHKYSAVIMRRYDWIIMIERKQLFHLGTAHNTCKRASIKKHSLLKLSPRLDDLFYWTTILIKLLSPVRRKDEKVLEIKVFLFIVSFDKVVGEGPVFTTFHLLR